MAEGDVYLNDLNTEIFGPGHLRRQFIRRSFRDVKSFAYLLSHFKLREFANFLYTKTIVPTGEGTQGWFYPLGLQRMILKYPDKAPFPQFTEIETTTICNKRCVICEYVHWPKGEQVKRHLRLDEFKHIVDQLPKLRWINMTGEGSSFLNKDYFLMLRHLWEKHRTSIWLVDHLSDIGFEKLRDEVFPYIHGIYVSMDAATGGTYETIKQGCNFDRVIDNLRSIIAYKRSKGTPFPHLSFRYVILKENLHEMPQYIDLLNSIAKPGEWGGSSSYVEFTGLLYFPEIVSHYVNEIPRNVVDELLKRRGKGIGFVFAHAEEKRNPPLEHCLAWMEPYIMLPGYMLPCCAVMMSNRRPFLRKYAFGNLFEKSFKDLWHGEYYTKLRRMIVDPCAPVPKICVGCRAYRTGERARENGVWDPYEDGTLKDGDRAPDVQ